MKKIIFIALVALAPTLFDALMEWLNSELEKAKNPTVKPLVNDKKTVN